jgi:hypothetical protein
MKLWKIRKPLNCFPSFTSIGKMDVIQDFVAKKKVWMAWMVLLLLEYDV